MTQVLWAHLVSNRFDQFLQCAMHVSHTQHFLLPTGSITFRCTNLNTTAL